MILNESDIVEIVKKCVKRLNEIHKGQQLMLPFDGSSEPYNYMHFLEWLESVGTYGKLPPPKNNIDSLYYNKVLMKDMGLATFYFSMGAELDDEGFEMFMDDFNSKYGPKIFISGEFPTDFVYPDDVPALLTEEGKKYWDEELISVGREKFDDWINHKITLNKEGLVYCEREIEISSPFERIDFADDYYDNRETMDYYSVLQDNYSGIGEYWSYAVGGACTYFNGRTKNPRPITLKGWVSPDDVAWSTSIELESMDEQELRLNYDGKVQIDRIEYWDEELGNVNLLSKGSIIVPVSQNPDTRQNQN